MFTLDQFKVGTRFRINALMAKVNDVPPDHVFTVALCDWDKSKGISIQLKTETGLFANDQDGVQGIHYLSEIMEILPD